MRELESTLTDRYQTTVPAAVRRALRLVKRDKLRYVLLADGAVLLTRAVPAEVTDPVFGKFLQFLAKDMQDNPRRIRSVEMTLVRQARSLVRRVKVDLDQPLRLPAPLP